MHVGEADQVGEPLVAEDERDLALILLHPVGMAGVRGQPPGQTRAGEHALVPGQVILTADIRQRLRSQPVGQRAGLLCCFLCNLGEKIIHQRIVRRRRRPSPNRR